MMDIPDGVYADATFHNDGSGAIGIVLICNGIVRTRFGERMTFLGNVDAEMEAVEQAMQMYPDLPVFTDCAQAAKACGAIQISRKFNGEAHRTASWAYSGLCLEDGSLPLDRPKNKKRPTRAEMRQAMKENLPRKYDGRNLCCRGLRTRSGKLRQHSPSIARESLPLPDRLKIVGTTK